MNMATAEQHREINEHSIRESGVRVYGHAHNGRMYSHP